MARFYLFELKEKKDLLEFENVFFLARNFLLFDISNYSNIDQVVLVDFGKDIRINVGFEYIDNLFKPVSIMWLDDSDLSVAIDLYWNISRHNVLSKGKFFENYINELEY